jgi:hypothetical protein
MCAFVHVTTSSSWPEKLLVLLDLCYLDLCGCCMQGCVADNLLQFYVNLQEIATVAFFQHFQMILLSLCKCTLCCPLYLWALTQIPSWENQLRKLHCSQVQLGMPCNGRWGTFTACCALGLKGSSLGCSKDWICMLISLPHSVCYHYYHNKCCLQICLMNCVMMIN